MKLWWKKYKKDHPNLGINFAMLLASFVILAGLAVAALSGQEFKLY